MAVGSEIRKEVLDMLELAGIAGNGEKIGCQIETHDCAPACMIIYPGLNGILQTKYFATI